MAQKEEFIPIEIVDFTKLPKPIKNKNNVKSKDEQEAFAYNQDVEQHYHTLLDRICGILKQNNPDLAQKNILNLKLPQVHKVSKRIIWDNFEETCNKIKRETVHVKDFFANETGNECVIQAQELSIKGRTKQKDIEQLLKKYIQEYVKCSLCTSTNTILKKDTNTRLYMIECGDCKSSKSVATLSKARH